jgi:hypothetical protein
MAVKISKRTREDAIMLCAMAASSSGHGIHDAWKALRWKNAPPPWKGWHPTNDAAYDLAHAAFNESGKHPWSRIDGDGWSQDWEAQMAGAEALLQTGWSPC